MLQLFSQCRIWVHLIRIRSSCSDGSGPFAGLIADRAGNLYGTTAGGGASGIGVVFKLSPSGTETVLYSFCSLPSLAARCCTPSAVCLAAATGIIPKPACLPTAPARVRPVAGLIADNRAIYGTTVNGGAGPGEG